MASPIKKVKLPPKITGTGAAISREKEMLRRGDADGVIGVRPMVPDDANSLGQYKTWVPGQLRPFVPQFNFTAHPGEALCKGPWSVPGGTLNAIKDQPAMSGQTIVFGHGKKG